MTNFPEGSVWRKWDLHVHSPASILANQFSYGDTERGWNEYLSRLANVDIAALGITDYFTIEGYKKVRTAWSAGKLPNIDLILPNVEFRLDEILYRDSDGKAPRRLNLHIIFSDQLDPSEIEDHFLHNLYFESRGSVDGKPFKERLKLSNLKELGRRLKKQLPNEHKDKSDVIVGAENATVSLEDIKNELTESGRFVDKYLVVLDEANTSLIKWGKQDTQTRLTLLQNSHMVFSSNPNTKSWCLGLQPWNYGTEQFIDTFDSLKLCIKGSDAHEAFFIGHQCSRREQHDCKSDSENCNLRFCWIKADPTFEGLRQVLYEPEERVFIGAAAPELPKSKYTISNVCFNKTVVDPELTMSATDVPINHNLVAVTGGKGAGKTALVDLIANCFEDRVSECNDNSFAWRICKDSQPSLRTGIHFLGAEAFEKDVSDSASLLNHVDVAYIKQGQLDRDVAETYRLTERIEQLVMSTALISDKHELERVKQQISDMLDKIRDTSQEIIRLSGEISLDTQADLWTRKKALEIDIEDLARQIENHSLSNNEIELAENASAQVANQESKYEKLKEMTTDIERAQSFLSRNMAEFNDIVLKINATAQELGIEMDAIAELAYSSESIDRIARIVEAETKSTLKLIDGSQAELEEQNRRVADHSKLIDEKRVSEDALRQIAIQLGEIDSTKKKIQNLRDSRVSHYRDLLEKMALRKQTFQRMMTNFLDRRAQDSNQSDPNRSNIMSGIDFYARNRFSRDSFLKKCNQLFDGRKVRPSDYKLYFGTTLQLLANFANEKDDAIDQLSKNVEKLADDSHLRESFVSGKGLSDFFKLVYGNHFALVPEVSYNNVPIDRLSIGQKATVLIKLYLADGVRPIIIDSHDDHLDNKFIYDELIPAIVEAKKSRQVIMVSNNANVVVNADAEQVIIAEHKDGTISYVSGALENPVIRDKAIEVLEGGELAFRERQQKYRLT